jgi:hypothetical protein
VVKVFCDQAPPSEISQIIFDSEAEFVVCDKELM